MRYVNAIESFLDKKAKIEFLPMQPGDVQMTYADSRLLYNWINFKPSTSIEEGISKFVSWYIKHYEK